VVDQRNVLGVLDLLVLGVSGEVLPAVVFVGDTLAAQANGRRGEAHEAPS
jgi:hypothetical protein